MTLLPLRNSGISLRRFVLITLSLQVVIALALVVSDVRARWPAAFETERDLPTGPVSPGDQVRRYERTKTAPDRRIVVGPPDLPVPEDVSGQLGFTVHDLDDERVVLLSGMVAQGDLQRFTNFLTTLQVQPARFVLNSPGGIVSEALALGRHLRAIGANTAVLGGMYCFSSCPYVLAGGTERQVSSRAAVGMHQHYFDTPGYVPVFMAIDSIQRGQGETMEYLMEMGIDPSLMIYSLSTPPDEIYVLLEEELLETSLATEIGE